MSQLDTLTLEELLPELNPAQRTLLADWLIANVVGEDDSTNDSPTFIMGEMHDKLAKNRLRTDLRQRIREMVG